MSLRKQTPFFEDFDPVYPLNDLAGSDTFYRPNSFSYSNPAQFIIPVLIL